MRIPSGILFLYYTKICFGFTNESYLKPVHRLEISQNLDLC